MQFKNWREESVYHQGFNAGFEKAWKKMMWTFGVGFTLAILLELIFISWLTGLTSLAG